MICAPYLNSVNLSYSESSVCHSTEYFRNGRNRKMSFLFQRTFTVILQWGHCRSLVKDFLCCLCPQMASATATYGQKESSDQNFDYMFKILIIGNSSVGKTSFLFRYADDSFTPAFVSTVGIDFKVKTIYRNDKRIKLQIWVRWQENKKNAMNQKVYLLCLLVSG